MAGWLLAIGSTYKCPYMGFLMLMLTQDGKPLVYEQHVPRCWCVRVCVCLCLLTKWYISKTMVSKWYIYPTTTITTSMIWMKIIVWQMDAWINVWICTTITKNKPARPHTRINIGHIGRWGWQNLSKSLWGKCCMYIYGLLSLQCNCKCFSI